MGNGVRNGGTRFPHKMDAGEYQYDTDCLRRNGSFSQQHPRRQKGGDGSQVTHTKKLNTIANHAEPASPTHPIAGTPVQS